ncbi:MAG: SprT family zinc-dependent metalloprotease [Candidatus Aminicenantales bacterium]
MKPDPEILILETARRKIPLHLERGKGRRLRITVLSDGRVRVIVPRRVGLAQVLAFAREKADWIVRTVGKVETYTRLYSPVKSAETGMISILGQSYPVKIEPGRGRRAAFADGVLHVPVADPDDKEAVRRRIEAWLKRRSLQVFGMVLRRGLAAASVHGIAAPTWTVRWMKRRWGSCGRDGRVVFNVRLVQTPLPLIEYVVLHELCHLKQHHHGRSFYALLGQCLPDWKERRKALNAIVVD